MTFKPGDIVILDKSPYGADHAAAVGYIASGLYEVWLCYADDTIYTICLKTGHCNGWQAKHFSKIDLDSLTLLEKVIYGL